MPKVPSPPPPPHAVDDYSSDGGGSRSYDGSYDGGDQNSRSYRSDDDSEPRPAEDGEDYSGHSRSSHPDSQSRSASYDDDAQSGDYSRTDEQSGSHPSHDNDSHYSNDNRSYVSGEEDGDGSYDSRSQGNDSRSYDSRDRSQGNDSRSYDSRDRSQGNETRSYDSRDRSQGNDSRSYDSRDRSQGNDSRSYDEEHDNEPQQDDDSRSYMSQDDQRSFVIGDEDHEPLDHSDFNEDDGSRSQSHSGSFRSGEDDVEDEENHPSRPVHNSSSSMSMSELNEEDHSESQSHSNSSHNEPVAAPVAVSPHRAAPPTVEENSMWLSQLDQESQASSSGSSTVSHSNRSGTDRLSPRNQQRTEASQSPCFSRSNGSGADQVSPQRNATQSPSKQRAAAAEAVAAAAMNEKSIWLSDLQEPSENSGSQDDTSAQQDRSESQRDDSYRSRHDDDCSNSQSYSNSNRDEDHTGSEHLDDSFVSREHDRRDNSFRSQGSQDEGNSRDGSYVSNAQSHDEHSQYSGSQQGNHDSRNSRDLDGSYVSRGSEHSHTNSNSQQHNSFGSHSQDESFRSQDDGQTEGTDGDSRPIQSPQRNSRKDGTNESKPKQNDSFVSGATRHEDSVVTEPGEARTLHPSELEESRYIGSSRHDSESEDEEEDDRRYLTESYGLHSASDIGKLSHHGTVSQNSDTTDDFESFANENTDHHGDSTTNSSGPLFESRSPERKASTVSAKVSPSFEASTSFSGSEDESDDGASNMSGFDSFANDASVMSGQQKLDREPSLRSIPQLESDDIDEDCSALSLLPANTYADKGLSNPLDEPSVMSESSSPDLDTSETLDDKVDEAPENIQSPRKPARDDTLQADKSVRTFDDYSSQHDDNSTDDYEDGNAMGEFSRRSVGPLEPESENVGPLFGDVNKGDFFTENKAMEISESGSVASDSQSQSDRSQDDESSLEVETPVPFQAPNADALLSAIKQATSTEVSAPEPDAKSNPFPFEPPSADALLSAIMQASSQVSAPDASPNKSKHSSKAKRDPSPTKMPASAKTKHGRIGVESGSPEKRSLKDQTSYFSNGDDAMKVEDPPTKISLESPNAKSQGSSSTGPTSLELNSAGALSPSIGSRGDASKSTASGSLASEHESEMEDCSPAGSRASFSENGNETRDDPKNDDDEQSVGTNDEAETSLRLPKPKTYNGYSREQMTKLVVKLRSNESATNKQGLPVSPRRRKRQNVRDRGKGEALLDFLSNVNDTMMHIEKEKDATGTKAKDGTLGHDIKDGNVDDEDVDEGMGASAREISEKGEEDGDTSKPQGEEEDKSKTDGVNGGDDVNATKVSVDGEAMRTSRRLLHAFEALVGIFLQLSDELELLLTFSKGKVSPAIEALESLLSFSKTISDTFVELNPILQHYLTAEIDEELDDFLYGMNLLVDLLCELSNRVGQKQQWNARANTAFVTMLELLLRDTLEVSCIFDDVDTPEYELTDMIQDAWEATGHDEEVKTLLVTTDLFMFRQICYEVMLSTDQWCPDNNTLMDICGVDDESDEGQVKPDDDDVLSPPPEAALQILEKIHGTPLPRTLLLASVLRRILPVQAITDSTISENFARIRNTIRNPLGMPPSSLVSVTSIPESLDDPDSLGIAGVGKTTLAAMVANHDDIRRFFNDGVAWIYVGESELNYNRYVQCLQDLLSQLEVEEDEEPLFPELLHIPGESYAMRRRREEGFMIYLRETMVEFLRYRNVLLVLDDVCFEPDLDWFDFAQAPLEDEQEDDEGSCAILITSRRRNLLPPADTVEVDMLSEDESIQLLIKESGELAHALVADAPETKSVVLECACHPLTIKTVARWLNLKHATSEATESVDDIRADVVKSLNKVISTGMSDDSDMMYEILNMSLSPAINGELTSIIKFCFAAFVRVFCERKHISDFALADSTPIIPMATTELLFGALLDLEEESLMGEGSLFDTQKNDAATLIPEALSALGIFKVIITYAEAAEGSSQQEEEDEKYLQIMHRIQQEYGEYLYEEDVTLTELTKDGERRWNKAFAKAFVAKQVEWDTQTPDAGLDYALEMLPSHMLRGGMLIEAGELLRNQKFVRGRLFALGRENGSRRHIKDCEALFESSSGKRLSGKKKLDPKVQLRSAYDVLGGLLKMDEDEYIDEEGSPEAVEVGRCHFEIGFSLAGRRCWEGAIAHWESSQEFLVSSLGMVELVAGILYNIGVVNTEMSEYEQALGSLKQCLRIRGAIHGEEHILYAQTIQKIGDVFLAMSDYHEAMESYNWALDVMHIEPSHHRVDIGDILEQMGKIHYSKGEIEEALQSFQDALRSKQIDLGEDHPELSTVFHQIGNCLSNQGRSDEAIAHLEEAIRLKNLDPDGGYERDSDVLTIEGILNNLNNMQKEGLECYEKALQILVTKVPHRKEKVASLLHLIGCVYLMSGEHKKAMKLFEESLHARRKVLGFVHLDVASTLFNMAFLHQSRNRLDKALKCLEEALKIRQLRLPDSEKVAVTHEKIGNLARGIGKTKKAENAFTEALGIRKKIHGSSHEAVATVLQELGDLMDDLGEYEEAMKHYVEALEIRENRLGPDDLAVAETYYSMGFTLQNNDALDRALQCLEESLSIRKFQLGDDAKDVGDTLNMMGFLQAKRGELDDALSLLWDSLRIRKLQADHVKVSETLNNIGNVHREKEEFDLAIECYEECLRIRRAELGDVHEKVADALIAKGNVQSDLDETEEAMDSYKEALAIRNMIFGEQDESVATVLQYMGTLEFRANELDRAFQLLDEFIRIRQENGTEPDGDYVNVLFVIGNIHKMQSNEEEAKKCWTEAYGVFKQLGLAETNPQIAEVMGNLVKDEEVVAPRGSGGGTGGAAAGDKGKGGGVLGRITAKVKKAARSANSAGNAVKKVTGIKGQDRGSQLL